MALIRSLFWLALFFVSTFAFTVILEHGPMNFREDAKKEFELLKKYVDGGVKRQEDKSDKVVP